MKYINIFKNNCVFQEFHNQSLCQYNEYIGIDWHLQLLDASVVEAWNVNDAKGYSYKIKGKNATKRSFISDKNGIPLGFICSSGNVHDQVMVKDTINQIKDIKPNKTHKIALDAGYDSKDCREFLLRNNYSPYIPKRKNSTRERTKFDKHLPGREKIETMFSWLNSFKRIKLRVEKTVKAYSSYLSFVCGNIILQTNVE